jgi:Uma2 family endonuclease
MEKLDTRLTQTAVTNGFSTFDFANLVTEDDEPVDNIPSSKQQRLLVDSLYNSTIVPRPFLADSNIALYDLPGQPPIVPDMFLSLGVRVANDWWEKENRSYLLSEFGKPPEIVIEIVSNTKGGEDERKRTLYASLQIAYYVIYDPQLLLSDDPLCIYELNDGVYEARSDYRLPEIGLALTLWRGSYEDKEDIWLRWLDNTGNMIPTGAERATQAEMRVEFVRRRAARAIIQAEQERQRAEQERQRAMQERERATQADARAEKLAAQLRALGIEPE